MNILRFSADSGKLCTCAYNSANALTVGFSSFSLVVVVRSVNENTVVATVPSSYNQTLYNFLNIYNINKYK